MNVPQFNELFNMFQLARNRLKYPKLNFILQTGEKVQLYLATKGYIAIKINGEYVGKLETDRNSFKLYQYTELTVPLMAWCKNPKQSAKIYGIQYKHCCFCNTELTTKQSVFAGYGPICAENFGLPWGETSTSNNNEPLISLD